MRAFVSVKDADKPVASDLARRLVALGFEVLATSGTAAYLAREGIPAPPGVANAGFCLT